MLANRLSANPSVKVLLLEAGGSESLFSDIPIAAATLQQGPLDWGYQTEPQSSSCFGFINQRSRWPRGKVLGGTSVLNYMLYIRGNRRDYDTWAVEAEAPEWSWENVFPYFLKSEDNRDEKMTGSRKLQVLPMNRFVSNRTMNYRISQEGWIINGGNTKRSN